MEKQEAIEVTVPKVVKVESCQAWDSLVAQSNNQGCPVVVHFTASWCIPSVLMNSFFEELASSYEDVMFLTIDVDEVKEVASKMEVKAMPTFVLMKQGGVQADKLVGANPDVLKQRIDDFLHSVRSIEVSN